MAVEQPSEEQQLAAEQPSEEEERVAAQPSEEEGEAAFKARFWARANYFAEWHARYAILNDWQEWEVPEDGLEWVGYLCPLEWEVLRSYPHFHIWQSAKPEGLRDMLEYDAKMTMAIKGWGEAICSKFGLSYARHDLRGPWGQLYVGVRQLSFPLCHDDPPGASGWLPPTFKAPPLAAAASAGPRTPTLKAPPPVRKPPAVAASVGPRPQNFNAPPPVLQRSVAASAGPQPPKLKAPPPVRKPPAVDASAGQRPPHFKEPPRVMNRVPVASAGASPDAALFPDRKAPPPAPDRPAVAIAARKAPPPVAASAGEAPGVHGAARQGRADHRDYYDRYYMITGRWAADEWATESEETATSSQSGSVVDLWMSSF